MPAMSLSIQTTTARIGRAIKRRMADDVVGNPLHEAWSADGEPVERISPEENAKRGDSRLVVPHSRSR
jgi:hypothetical protein